MYFQAWPNLYDKSWRKIILINKVFQYIFKNNKRKILLMILSLKMHLDLNILNAIPTKHGYFSFFTDVGSFKSSPQYSTQPFIQMKTLHLKDPINCVTYSLHPGTFSLLSCKQLCWFFLFWGLI